MKPWQFPSGQWIDLECIQTVSVIMEQTDQQTSDGPVTLRRWFSLTMAFQTQPLTIQVFNHHEGRQLSDERWANACFGLERERGAVVNAWRGSDAIELVFDVTSVQDALVNTTPAGYEVELTVLIANDVPGQQLVEFIQSLPQLAKPVEDEGFKLSEGADAYETTEGAQSSADQKDSDEWN
jgi:hypothetical protein